MNLSALFPCFSDHLILVSDFRQLPCQKFLQFSPIFLHCRLHIGIFIAWGIGMNFCTRLLWVLGFIPFAVMWSFFLVLHMAWMFVVKQGRQSQHTKKLLFRNVPANMVSSNKRKTAYAGGARFIVFALRDPYLKKERRHGRSSHPYRVPALRWSNHLDFHCGWSQRRQFLRQVLKEPLEHGRAAWQHDMNVQILADVHVTRHIALERSVVESALGWKTLSRNGNIRRHLKWCFRLGDIGLILVDFRRRFELCVE